MERFGYGNINSPARMEEFKNDYERGVVMKQLCAKYRVTNRSIHALLDTLGVPRRGTNKLPPEKRQGAKKIYVLFSKEDFNVLSKYAHDKKVHVSRIIRDQVMVLLKEAKKAG